MTLLTLTVAPSRNNANHNHTPRTENSLEQIQLSVPGDEKISTLTHRPQP